MNEVYKNLKEEPFIMVAGRLNGDEVATFRLDKPTLLKIRLFHY